MAEAVLANELVIFTISGYLPGEYVLRVFPLLCKGMQSLQYFLSLLGPPVCVAPQFYSPTWIPNPKRTTIPYDLEGEIYGIYSAWRDLKRIVMLGHSVNALMLKGTESFSAKENNDKVFSSIEWLYFNMPQQDWTFPFSLGCFPKLTKLDIDAKIEPSQAERLLYDIWSLPLTSFAIKDFSVPLDVKRLLDDRPPAFASTLRALKTRSYGLMELLSLYCRSLEEIEGNGYHQIMANSPGLTSLTLILSFGFQPIDLTQLTRLKLKKLEIRGYRAFVSNGRYSSLQEVVLEDPHTESACELLTQCSTSLAHLSLNCIKWETIIQLTTVLDPKVCKRLTLAVSEDSIPSLAQVERAILRRGFQITNEEFLLYTSDAMDNCGRIVEIAPHIKNVTIFRHEEFRVGVPPPPSFFTFYGLSILHLRSTYQWTQDVLGFVAKHCPSLKDLNLCLTRYFSGTFKLKLLFLRKLNLTFKTGCPTFNLKLPNVTHLELGLPFKEGVFLGQLLDGDPAIDLPQLRVLFLSLLEREEISPPVPPLKCKAGHPSLTRIVVMNELRKFLDVSHISLRKLPKLKQVKLQSLSTRSTIALDLPGACDVICVSNGSTYSHQGSLDNGLSNFVVKLHHDEQRWVENNTKDDSPKEFGEKKTNNKKQQKSKEKNIGNKKQHKESKRDREKRQFIENIMNIPEEKIIDKQEKQHQLKKINKEKQHEEKKVDNKEKQHKGQIISDKGKQHKTKTLSAANPSRTSVWRRVEH